MQMIPFASARMNIKRTPRYKTKSILLLAPISCKSQWKGRRKDEVKVSWLIFVTISCGLGHRVRRRYTWNDTSLPIGG